MPAAPPPVPPPSPGSRPTPRRSGAAAAHRPLPPRSDFWLERAGRLLTRTHAEWTAIAGETMTPRSIYRGFLVPMAALGPLATTLGTMLSGGQRSSLAFTYALSLPRALFAGALEYAFNLGAIWVLALLIDRLAPAFEAQQSRPEALKLAAFGATPYWLGGVLGVIPRLAPLGVVLGLYSIRLFALGLAPLMRAPAARLSGYTLAVGAVALVLVLLGSALLLSVTS